MRRKLIFVVAVCLGMLAGMVGARAADSTCSVASSTLTCTANLSQSPTLEPILTRSSAFEVDADRACPLVGVGLPTSENQDTCSMNATNNGSAKITSLKVAAGVTLDGKGGPGKITAKVTVRQPLVRDNLALTNIAPYSGQHVLVMFKTKPFEINQKTGTTASGADATWGPPGFNADRFAWFMYFGWTASEQRDICGMGYVDPTGALAPPAPVFFGQTFFSVGQKNSTYQYQPNTVCTVSSDGKTVYIVQPYTYTWGATSGTLARSVKLVDLSNSLPGCNGSSSDVHKRCDTLFDISGFSWFDHEAGGPDPVGLILGWTWYTDSIPKSAYSIGQIAGDPNPSSLAGPGCYTNFIGGDPTTAITGGDQGLLGPGTPGPCMTQNPIGTGFNGTSNKIQATS